MRLRASVVESFARFRELDLLEAFRDQDGNPHIVQHGSTSQIKEAAGYAASLWSSRRSARR